MIPVTGVLLYVVLSSIPLLQADGKRCISKAGECSNWVACSPNGNLVAWSGWKPDDANPTIRVWDVKASKSLPSITVQSEIPVHRAAFSPDGKILAGVASKGNKLPCTIRLWDVGTWKLRQEIPTPEVERAYAIRFSRQGNLLYLCGSGKVVPVIDVKEGKVIKSINVGASTDDVALTFDGKFLACIDQGGWVKVFSVETGNETVSLNDIPVNGSEPWTSALDFSPTQYLLANVRSAPTATKKEGGEKIIDVWDFEKKTLLYSLRSERDSFNCGRIWFSPDGAYLGAIDNKSHITFWDVGTKKETQTLGVAGVRDFVFGRDNKTVFVAGGDGVYICPTNLPAKK
jgi:WD40 repeat protein